MVESGIKPRSVWELQWSGKSTGVGVKNAFIHIATATFVHRGWCARFMALHRGCNSVPQMEECVFSSHFSCHPTHYHSPSTHWFLREVVTAQVSRRPGHRDGFCSALHTAESQHTESGLFRWDSFAGDPVWILFHFLVTWIKTNPSSLRTWSLVQVVHKRL